MLVGDVGDERRDVTAALAHERRGRIEAGGVDVERRDPGSLRSEHDAGLAAHAAAGPGDEGDLAVEPAGAIHVTHPPGRLRRAQPEGAILRS